MKYFDCVVLNMNIPQVINVPPFYCIEGRQQLMILVYRSGTMPLLTTFRHSQSISVFFRILFSPSSAFPHVIFSHISQEWILSSKCYIACLQEFGRKTESVTGVKNDRTIDPSLLNNNEISQLI